MGRDGLKVTDSDTLSHEVSTNYLCLLWCDDEVTRRPDIIFTYPPARKW